MLAGFLGRFHASGALGGKNKRWFHILQAFRSHPVSYIQTTRVHGLGRPTSEEQIP